MTSVLRMENCNLLGFNDTGCKMSNFNFTVKFKLSLLQ